MLKRTLFFSKPYHLSARSEQLVIANKEDGEETTAPIEDLGFVVLEHPQITLTQSVVQRLASNNTALIFCDERYLPSSMLLHLDTNQVQNERFRAQIDASEPLKKGLWQQTVKAKVRNQGELIQKLGGSAQPFHHMEKQVRSGDMSGEEGKAAKRYWPALFGKDFRRERSGEPPNNALNYGYAVLRAAVSRALMGTGLLPTLGIHHRNKYNAFCLADDIMEPYRPFVDDIVHGMVERGKELEELEKEEKAELLGIFSSDVYMDKKMRPLMVALSHTTASLKDCFEGEVRKLRYPSLSKS